MAHAVRTIDLSSENRRIDGIAPGLMRKAGLIGVGGIVVALVLAMVVGLSQGGVGEAFAQFFRSYILAFGYVMSIALGALIFVLLQHLTRAGWSVAVRRVAECFCAPIPWLGILAIPVLIPVFLGMTGVYEWSNRAAVQADESGLLQKKTPYLNTWFFTIRFVLYFLVWSWLAGTMFRKSTEQDITGDPQLTVEMGRLSAPGVLIFALTTTFFAFDLLMSLAPHWFSTIFGVYYFSGCMVGFFATLSLTLSLLQRSGRLLQTITAEHYHDVGKFLFAFVVFWAYIGYSQYMLIWYANIPEETFWYQARQATGWWIGVSVFLLFGHFFVPFLALISRFPKRRPNLLIAGACWMLFMHFVDLYYLVAPDVHGFQHGGSMKPGALHLLTDIPATIGLCGFFAYFVISRMAQYSLLPERDPRLAESLVFENF